jgi:thiol-disulfide isomerase/thioredoxin
MKRFVPFLAAMVFAIMTGFAQHPIQVSGKVQFLNPEIFKKYNMVWLKKGIGKQLVTVDSAQIGEDGKFAFHLEGKPALYQLDVLKWQTVNFWSDADVFVNCRGYDTARVKSKNSGFIALESTSAANKLLNVAVFGKIQDKFLMDELYVEGMSAQQHRATDSTWYNHFRKQNLYRSVELQSDERLKSLISNYRGNPATVFLLSLLDPKRNAPYVLAQLDTLSGLEEALQLKKEIQTDLEIEKNTANGGTIPLVSYPGPDGKNVLLRPVKGNYLLIDFWASWCGPCRKSIPKIKELYALYKNKGLEIVSVSIDTDDKAWRGAMADEQMPWKQVLSPDKDKTLKDFNIQGVPTLFLIDRQGRIVQKFTGYSSKLEELLKLKL